MIIVRTKGVVSVYMAMCTSTLKGAAQHVINLSKKRGKGSGVVRVRRKTSGLVQQVMAIQVGINACEQDNAE